MNNQHTVFKVVRRTSKGLKSCVVSSLYANSVWCLTYAPNKWTEARPGTGILVFRCPLGAEIFSTELDISYSFEIWEAVAEGEILLPPYRASTGQTRHFSQAWWGHSQDKSFLSTLWPWNTAAFKRVQLVERLEPEPLSEKGVR